MKRWNKRFAVSASLSTRYALNKSPAKAVVGMYACK